MEGVHYRLLTTLIIITANLHKFALSDGTFKVTLDYYREKLRDTTTKCIQLCVTSSSDKQQRCNLNTTTGNSEVQVVRIMNWPVPFEYSYSFDHWADNSELGLTLWKLPVGKKCDTSRPTDNTMYGTGVAIIPRVTIVRTQIITDPAGKWDMSVKTQIICGGSTPDCLPPCVPRDDSNGHYTCLDGNKDCLANWYGSDCTIPCTSRNDSLGHYTCSDDGVKQCMENWYGQNCTVFCDVNANTYNCSETRFCLTNWFGEECGVFCNQSASNYACLENGTKICRAHWYGPECDVFCDHSLAWWWYRCSDTGDKICNQPNYFGLDCSTYCNATASNYKCNPDGSITCTENWFNENCTKFCDNSSVRYKCNKDGGYMCNSNWFGFNCSKFCNISSSTYNCSGNGEKICNENLYGENCTRFCNTTAVNYNCSKNGERVCALNWYDSDCSRFCDTTALNYNCSEHGDRICRANWYGKDCATFCKTTNARQYCNSEGKYVCQPHWYPEPDQQSGIGCDRFCHVSNFTRQKCDAAGILVCAEDWYGKECGVFCEGGSKYYNCDDDGRKVCVEHRFGEYCETFCQDANSTTFKCRADGKKECLAGWHGVGCTWKCQALDQVAQLYSCEIKKAKKARCPESWLEVGCSSSCFEKDNNKMENALKGCQNNAETIQLCTRYYRTKLKCAENPGSNEKHRQKVFMMLVGLGAFFIIITIIAIVVLFITRKNRRSRVSALRLAVREVKSNNVESPRAQANRFSSLQSHSICGEGTPKYDVK